MHVHILGICGTFMGSLAVLAKQLGHTVTGSDANVYPPMSTQLEEQGISLIQGYDPSQLEPRPDVVVVGNAMSRGNPCVEYVLDNGLNYTSGPRWLLENVLRDKWVLAVSGTHGKTTTSAMLTWVLESAKMAPGFLIGGVPKDFPCSARLGDTPFFVIEADEYDSAFFDKRSKFVHYQPRTLIINNLEFDHADIFDDIAAIQRQFHHLVRTVPGNGLIISPSETPLVDEVITQGCWTPVQSFGEQGDWQAKLLCDDGSRFEVYFEGQAVGVVDWQMTGRHSVNNALATLAAARHVGVTPAIGVEALSSFAGVKRRMEKLAEVDGVTIFDDFAHHPTAIETTLQGLRKQHPNSPITAIIEPRSNTMKLGVHQSKLIASADLADTVAWYQPDGQGWDLSALIGAGDKPKHSVYNQTQLLIDALLPRLANGEQVVIMSNGGFEGIHQRLISALEQRVSA
ncbi:UDP-N-acetylmuramate--L-alanyl-gamma-D-glutamyl-meso-2,6-diaminoheptandioate ligase [Sinobacterium norvegicum]|uniref:UDP-N-acetylmuramate--L-alanyl-gamma-D-glutamyl-meso-2,6-diaminoheptandioate ligase n=1 Tax=Sinobacterium norvegicum TaxID=1641715 RepID=A0ABM9AGT7_9GAMM|nr:UDP-N-acetylmuramate:L-alanyl-gamma-D-glutamyl-meso-diaminopimelate ligase [Sinobacterium norvegicum]CAH0992417.1 UDP-N-acetylmuramate--L-alanyl-gamma-D-glutamyl-meso-2,6-diaminoheptandioate ligase [Sinobacterium norvegicum]